MTARIVPFPTGRAGKPLATLRRDCRPLSALAGQSSDPHDDMVAHRARARLARALKRGAP